MNVSERAPVLSVRDLVVLVPAGGRAVPAVRGVGFDLAPGARLGLVGESGSGKTLTALALMQMMPPGTRIAGGSVRLDGTDLLGLTAKQMCAVRGRRLSMVYQNPMSALNPVVAIGDQLVEAIRMHEPTAKSVARARAIDLLGDVGIPNPAHRLTAYPYQLSGGMRQRIVIAMALACEPQVIVADEPTTALDVTTQARVMALLLQLSQARGAAVILITHDLEVAAEFCDDIQVMYAGRIVERSPAGTLFDAPRHPYAKALLDSRCVLTTDLETPIPTIPGQPPHPGEFPPGCSFAARCPRAQDLCLRVDPELTVDPAGPSDREVACHFPFDPVAGQVAGDFDATREDR